MCKSKSDTWQGKGLRFECTGTKRFKYKREANLKFQIENGQRSCLILSKNILPLDQFLARLVNISPFFRSSSAQSNYGKLEL